MYGKQQNQGTQKRGHFFGAFLVVIAAICMVSIFGSGSHFGNKFERRATKANTTLPAEALVELEPAPEFSADQLHRIVQAVTDRAADGDVDAASLVFQLAALQQTGDTPSVDEAPGPGDRLAGLFGKK